MKENIKQAFKVNLLHKIILLNAGFDIYLPLFRDTYICISIYIYENKNINT